MKKKILSFMLLFCSLAILMALFDELKRKKNKVDEVTTEEMPVSYDEQDYYTFGEVSKYMQYLANDEEQKNTLNRIVDPLTYSQPITLGYLRQALEVIGIEDTVLDASLAGKSDDTLVTKDQFDAMLLSITYNENVKGLSREEFFVFDRYDGEDGFSYVTNGSKNYQLDAEFSDEYLDRVLDVYVRDGVLFRIMGDGITSYTIHNAFLLDMSDVECTIMYNGVAKQYEFSQYTTALDPGNRSQNGQVVSVKIDNTGVVAITPQKDVSNVRITDVTSEGIEVNGRAVYPCADDFMIYNCEDEPYCEDSKQILLGYPSVDIVKEDGQAIAIVVKEPLVSEDIRVILSNNDYTSYNMERVMLTCPCDFIVSDKIGQMTRYYAGDNVTFMAEDYEAGDYFVIEPVETSQKITLTSILRGYGNPSYHGKIEVHVVEDDMLQIINVVPLEQYLYTVVSSEAPAGIHPEARRALAICARGYAYFKMQDGSFSDYDAHLDDSSLCQVYNNVEATKDAVMAVKDTYGIVPTMDGNVILPLYFSTSAGVTGTNADIWGGTAYAYLNSNLETINKDIVILSDENMFKEFIDNCLGFDLIEKNEPMFRWTISYTKAEMTKAIASTLEERIRVSSDNIKVKTGEDRYESKSIETIGDVVSVKVVERTPCGVVSALEIEGTEATIRVTGEINIRALITPVNQEIVRNDGQVITGWNSLPSSYYYVAEENGGFVIHGGGFGHGVGLSQMGANVLAEQGRNYQFILKHYYSNIELTPIYSAADADIEEETEDGEN